MESKVKAIVTDIEGTTSSISFVKDVLFPYAYENLESFINNNSGDNNVIQILKQVHSDQDEAIKILKHWIKLDLKEKPLKDLQGLIWEAGYQQGDYQGHIFDDAYQMLKQWHEAGIKLYVYSSGSVYAQKLLFGHTKYGDLNSLFTGNFDTAIGHKREAKSYIHIYEAILQEIPEIEPQEIVFLSDISAEIEAAQETGLETRLITRESGDSFYNLGLY